MTKRGENIKEKKTLRIGSPLSPRLLPLKKAAEWLGISTWGLREQVWKGNLPVFRFPDGRKMYLDIRDLEEFISKNKVVIE